MFIESDTSSNSSSCSNNTQLGMMETERFDPCRVCGEASSGWHCGAVTCEACKKFFLRSVRGDAPKYRCMRNMQCVITRSTRTQCQYCRFQKCQDVGMMKEAPSSPTVAELFKSFGCAVCKSPSSGYHFGAITCEGCKGFFRRSIKERAPERYKCQDESNCDIVSQAKSRNMCRACRFKKCIRVGMSSKNSRIGRQSNLFKHNIIECQSRGIKPTLDYFVAQKNKVKRERDSLEEMSSSLSLSTTFDNGIATQVQATTSQTSVTASLPLPVAAAASHQFGTASVPQIISVNQYTTNQTYVINNISTGDPAKWMPTATQSYANPAYYTWQNYNTGEPTAASCYPAAMTSSMHPPALPPPPIIHNQQIQQPYNMISTSKSPEDSLDTENRDLIKYVYECYKSFIGPEVMLKRDLKTNLSPITNTVNNSRQLQIGYHHQNGAGYSENSSSYYDIGCFNEIVDHCCFYAARVGYFLDAVCMKTQLSPEDREQLIKSSVHSVVILSIQRKCDYNNYFNADQVKMDKILRLFGSFGDATVRFKNVRDRFEHEFKLDEKEYALYSALMVINTANRKLKDYDSVSNMRDSLGTAFRLYMQQRRNDETTCDNIVVELCKFKKFNMSMQRAITADCESLKALINSRCSPRIDEFVSLFISK